MRYLEIIRDVDWRPGMGDPTPIGYLTAALYFVTAFLCWLAARRARGLADKARRRQTRAFWFIAAVFMFLLGLNKQLDLQTLATRVAREIAAQQGWYTRRVEVQKVICVYAVILSGVMLLAFGALLRRALRRTWLAMAGIVTLTAYVLIRGVSYHRLDVMMGRMFGPIKVYKFIELIGIACVALSAFLNSRRSAEAAEEQLGRPDADGRDAPS